MGGRGSGGARPNSGPPPDPTAAQRNRKDDKATWQNVTVDDQAYGPEMPDFDMCFGTRGLWGTDWCQMSADWYEAMRRIPGAKELIDADWRYIIDTLMLHHLWMLTKDNKYAKDVHSRSLQFAVTMAERRRLRMKLEETVPDSAGSGVTPEKEKELQNRRERLLRSV